MSSAVDRSSEFLQERSTDGLLLSTVRLQVRELFFPSIMKLDQVLERATGAVDRSSWAVDRWKMSVLVRSTVQHLLSTVRLNLMRSQRDDFESRVEFWLSVEAGIVSGRPNIWSGRPLAVAFASFSRFACRPPLHSFVSAMCGRPILHSGRPIAALQLTPLKLSSVPLSCSLILLGGRPFIISGRPLRLFLSCLILFISFSFVAFLDIIHDHMTLSFLHT